MADISTTTKLIDLALLTTYDTEIKKVIDDSVDTTSLHTVALDSSVRKIYFYTEKSADVTVGTTTPAFTVDLSDIDTNMGKLSDLTTIAKSSLVSAINELDAELGTITAAAMGTTATTVSGAIKEHTDAIAKINGDDTTAGSFAKAIKDAVEALDVTEVGGSGKFISAIKEEDGKITATATDVTDVTGDLKDGTTARTVKQYVDDTVTAKVESLDTTADVVIASQDSTTKKVTLKAGIKEVDGVIAQGTGTDITLGTAANSDVKTTAISDADAEAATIDNNLTTAAQVAKYVKDKTAALTGAMHFTYSVTPTTGQSDVDAIAAKYTAESATPAKGDFVVITTDSKEYVYDGSAWVELGDESLYVTKATTIAGVDLQDNITKAEMLTALNVADGAQVNVLEGVQVNGSDLTADANKKVNVTVAKGATNGTIAVNGTDVAVNLVLAEDQDVKDLFK